MRETAALTRRDEEHLVRALEFSLPIRTRGQFFLWIRGVLQALIPHELLFCGLGKTGEEPVVTDLYTAHPFSEEAYREICGPAHGLLRSAYRAWQENGHTPLLIHPDAAHSWLVERFGEQVERFDLRNFALHGMPGYHGGPSSFFCFARIPDGLGPRHAFLLELVLPSLHIAFLRAHADHAVPPKRTRASMAFVPHPMSNFPTEREVQILRWIQEGKSNREIGEILAISPFTVKNHVQNILKKLNVKNRTQAVSFALAARFIDSQPTGDTFWAGSVSQP
jgi:transcriptional regulator EpsA